ncbi:LptF/LptG family permease [Peteryoungia desertarenae]|uniref:LptF/LptG family permease n=1 Tax=Peteryoungia desertarenae TaxID=1813451 RepID=A0ABX6QNY0_9HYPH|nr:LptF/LptG family permease [Peteryoungia desertarenae]QLF70006.1 LptF/LptG family permease [Peteryoungia desertarenae]
MKLLERYILRRVVQMFLTALLPVLAIIWTTQVLQRINLVTDSGQSVGSFMMLATLILPTLVSAVLPFALVIGITQTLTTMNNDSELAVIDAAGAPRGIIARPIVGLAILLSIFSFFMVNFVESKVRVGVREMIASAYADLLSTVIEEKSFRQLGEGLYVQISERQGRILKGLLVADSRDPNSSFIYYAREGAVEEGGDALLMHDGEVQRKTLEGNVTVIRFDSYSFDLSELTANRGQASLSYRDRDLTFLLNPDPDEPQYRERPERFHAELHRRLSIWLFPLAFALIALVICGDARSHREARVHPMVGSLVSGFALFGLSNYTVSLAERQPNLTLLIYLLPIGIIVVCVFSLMTGKRPRLPRPVSNLLAQMLSNIRRMTTDRLAGQQGGSP